MLKKNIAKMQGLSLIELMIAMVVGIFLIGGLSSIYLNSKGTDKMRSQISEMEENARTALMSMRHIISHAGYPSEYSLLIEKPVYTTAHMMERKIGHRQTTCPDSEENGKIPKTQTCQKYLYGKDTCQNNAHP